MVATKKGMGTRKKERERGRGTSGKKKKDEVMKWKSFTLSLLLLVMVGKRIKEPGIFASVEKVSWSIFRFSDNTRRSVHVYLHRSVFREDIDIPSLKISRFFIVPRSFPFVRR